jgi:glycosyltransferase involved in cell wall biosynthesis
MDAARVAVAIVSEPGKAGVKTHVVDLLTNVDLKRFEITYYYSLERSDDAYIGEIAALRARGIECIEIPMDARLAFRADLRALIRLTRQLRQKRPAILHLHSSKAGGLGRLASLLMRRRPRVIYTPHAMACYRSRVYLWLERVLGYFTNTLVAVSPSEKQDFVRWRIPHAGRSETIPLGMPAVEQSTATPQSAPGAQTWTVGACGRISYQKNALFFFQVALEVLRANKDYCFKWIGDFANDREGKAVAALLARAGNPPGIQITGWVRQPQVELRTLDVFCMFSRYESFGYVTAEAMQLGVPVLATPATGTVDLVRHEETGLLAEPEVDAIVSALDRLKNDPALRARLVANARQFIAENHTIAQMVDAVERLYAQPHSRG